MGEFIEFILFFVLFMVGAFILFYYGSTVIGETIGVIFLLVGVAVLINIQIGQMKRGW
jgi:fatty-acid desaturase